MRINHLRTLAGAELVRKALLPEDLVQYFSPITSTSDQAYIYPKPGITVLYGWGVGERTVKVDGFIFDKEMMLESDEFSGRYKAILWHEIDWNNFYIIDARFVNNEAHA